MSLIRTKEFLRDNWVSIIIVVGVFVLFFGFLSWVSNPPTHQEMQNRATKGDAFGILNTLFSGLAFSGLIIAISLQSRELSLQRQELEITRKVFEGQTDEFKKQSELLKQQILDSRVVQLVSLLNEERSSIPKNSFSRILDNARYAAESGQSLRGSLLKDLGDTWKYFEKYLMLLEYLVDITKNYEIYKQLILSRLGNDEFISIVLFAHNYLVCEKISRELNLLEEFEKAAAVPGSLDAPLLKKAKEEGLLDGLSQFPESA